MDSKSISREGVGVQVPASAPHSELSGALIPVLIHKLNNITQVLSGVNALVSLTQDLGVLDQHAESLEHAALELDRLGWTLGMLGAAHGSDLLFARRERQALNWSLQALVELYGRERRVLSVPSKLPMLAPDAAQSARCWELLQWIRAQAQGPQVVLQLAQEGEAWIWRLEGSAAQLGWPLASMEPVP